MTALGAAVAAALAAGISPKGLLSLRQHADRETEAANTFHPRVDADTRRRWMAGWRTAVDRSFRWTSDVDKATDGTENG